MRRWRGDGVAMHGRAGAAGRPMRRVAAMAWRAREDATGAPASRVEARRWRGDPTTTPAPRVQNHTGWHPQSAKKSCWGIFAATQASFKSKTASWASFRSTAVMCFGFSRR